ncbi:MAG: HD domain-containing phosphohydrolase [Pseudomonadota bacterium]
MDPLSNSQQEEQPIHILVVDDEMSILKLLHAQITKAGYQCHTASDGHEAIDILKEIPIDVVITDIDMPGLSGIELSKIIQETYYSDVILMSGHVDAYAYDQVVEKGASDFVQKPVNTKEFFLRLNRVLKERRTVAQRNRAEMELIQSLDRQSAIIKGIIQAMSLTVETRDRYTAGHQNRVASLARAISREMGIGEDRIEQIHMAGVIHDLGKIAVPAEILSNPGKLTLHEFGIMKTHPQVAYSILKTIDFPWPIATIVQQHHEKLDGSGYPDQLKGSQICLEARILSVADVVEAIASHRPYRPALGIDFALAEVTRLKAAAFDPDAVDACVRLFREGRYVLE